jgi:L-iditol 2-dehydrogenase
MKAAYLVGMNQLEIRQAPDPECPPDGLLLRVHFCGVCGSDLRRWKEGLPPNGTPFIPGHEISGEVVAIGEHLRCQYQVGDRLAVAPDVHCGECYYCQRGLYNLCTSLRFIGINPELWGGFLDVLPLDGNVLANGVVHLMPEGMPFSAAALAEPASSVLATHHRLSTSLSDTVLVMGSGPIGCLHIAVARARGARVILSEPSKIRREMAQRFHPDAVVDPFNEDLVSIVRQVTGGLGADIAICANPVAATQTQAVECVRRGGKVILFGGLPKSQPMTSLDANRIHYGEIEVWGAFSYHPSFHELALHAIQRGVVSEKSLVTHIFPLRQVNDAFTASAMGEALKVLVKVAEE